MSRSTILCPSCAHTCEEEVHFCPHCRSPITSYASTGPFESVFAEGAAYRAAIGTPTKPIVVAGVWMIFLPYAAYGLAAIKIFAGRCISPGFDGLEVEDLFVLLFGLLSTPLGAYALYRTTRNYLNHRKTVPEDGMAERAPRPSNRLD